MPGDKMKELVFTEIDGGKPFYMMGVQVKNSIDP
jgi:hypothetical protein